MTLTKAGSVTNSRCSENHSCHR